METQLDSFLSLTLSLILLLPSAIIIYSIGERIRKRKENKAINDQLKSMTDKVNYALEKYNNKSTKQKELSVLKHEAECVKSHIDSLTNEVFNKKYNLDLISIQIEQEEERIRIAKAKLMIINTEIQNYK